MVAGLSFWMMICRGCWGAGWCVTSSRGNIEKARASHCDRAMCKSASVAPGLAHFCAQALKRHNAIKARMLFFAMGPVSTGRDIRRKGASDGRNYSGPSPNPPARRASRRAVSRQLAEADRRQASARPGVRSASRSAAREVKGRDKALRRPGWRANKVGPSKAGKGGGWAATARAGRRAGRQAGRSGGAALGALARRHAPPAHQMRGGGGLIMITRADFFRVGVGLQPDTEAS